MWHIIRMRQSWIFRLNHFWCEKIVLGPPSGKNQNFWKFFWWRHNPVKSPKLAKNNIIQLIEWNLYQKRQNKYAFAILKDQNWKMKTTGPPNRTRSMDESKMFHTGFIPFNNEIESLLDNKWFIGHSKVIMNHVNDLIFVPHDSIWGTGYHSPTSLLQTRITNNSQGNKWNNTDFVFYSFYYESITVWRSFE